MKEKYVTPKSLEVEYFYQEESFYHSHGAMIVAFEQVKLFCRILGFPWSEHICFIDDDPHGIADLQDDYHYFIMSDIHALLADYVHWFTLYGDHLSLRRVVDEWYDCRLKMKEPDDNSQNCDLKKWLMGWRPKPEDCLPEYIKWRESSAREAEKRVEEAKAELNKEIDEIRSIITNNIF